MVSKREGFVLFSLVLVFTVLFSLNFASAAINITSPTDGANHTKTNILFNVSYTNASGDILNPTNATFYAHPNGDGTRITIGNTTASAGCSPNSCSVLLNFSIADGNYTINATIFNATASINVSGNINSSLSVRFDTTVPDVTSSNLSNPLSTGWNYSNTVFGVLILNVSVSDVTSSIQGVYFNITNSTGVQNRTISATNSAGNQWNATLDTTIYPDGLYNITIYVNDTSGNLNNSAIVHSLTFDNTAPSASVSCTPNPVEQGDTITCTCSGSDVHSGVSSVGTVTPSPSTSNSGPQTVSCAVTNYANLTSASASFEYTVSAGSGGSGGSSGGGSSGTTTGVGASTGKVQRTFDAISAGSSKIISGLDSSYAIKSLEISVNNKVQDVKVIINKFDGKPAAVSIAKTGKVYKYLEISASNVEGKIDRATINTLVSKKWVSDNQLTTDKIALFRLVNSVWVELPTTVSEEGSNYVLTSTSPGFSYFSIAEKVSPAKDAEAVTKDQGTAPVAPEKSSSSSMKWIIGIIVLLVIVLVVFLIKKKVTSRKK